jgi:hypothetical protein
VTRHATERLATRASPAAAERGLSLLRARAALVALLHDWAARDPRFDVDVVAFALEPGDAAAHALVDRAGHGVTCLGPGMAVNAPIVPFSSTTAFLDAQARLLQARRAVLAANDADEHHSPLVRAVEHPHRLVRDEVLALRALLPLVGVEHHAAAAKIAVDEVIAVAGGHRTSEAALQASWRLIVGGATSFVVAGHDKALFPASVAAIATGEPRLGVPALWQLVHHPEQTLELCRAAVDVERSVLHDALVDVVLPALAVRCAGFARDADAVARQLQRTCARTPTGLGNVDALVVDWMRQLLLSLPRVLRRHCPDQELAMHRARAPTLAPRLRETRTVDEVMAMASPWASLVLRAWNLRARRAEAPRTAVRSTASLTDAERAALALWRTLIVDAPLPLRGAGGVLALLVVHAPIEALLPGEEPDPDLALSKGVAWLRDDLPALLGVAAPGQTRPTPPRSASTKTTQTKKRKKKA